MYRAIIYSSYYSDGVEESRWMGPGGACDSLQGARTVETAVGDTWESYPLRPEIILSRDSGALCRIVGEGIPPHLCEGNVRMGETRLYSLRELPRLLAAMRAANPIPDTPHVVEAP